MINLTKSAKNIEIYKLLLNTKLKYPEMKNLSITINSIQNKTEVNFHFDLFGRILHRTCLSDSIDASANQIMKDINVIYHTVKSYIKTPLPVGAHNNLTRSA